MCIRDSDCTADSFTFPACFMVSQIVVYFDKSDNPFSTFDMLFNASFTDVYSRPNVSQ